MNDERAFQTAWENMKKAVSEGYTYEAVPGRMGDYLVHGTNGQTYEVVYVPAAEGFGEEAYFSCDCPFCDNRKRHTFCKHALLVQEIETLKAERSFLPELHQVAAKAMQSERDEQLAEENYLCARYEEQQAGYQDWFMDYDAMKDARIERAIYLHGNGALVTA